MGTAVVATGYGGPEVLHLVGVPIPQPGPGEVRIAVRAAGVNPIDYKAYSGTFGADPAKLPMRLGAEAAGVVTEVGPGVDTLAPGDEVIAFRASGAYATDLVVPLDAVVPKPAGLGWEQAGGLLLTGATAWHTVEAVGLRTGDTVLVHGGTGGVGLFAVQLAAARGATVIATASERNNALLRELGAVPVTYGAGLADRVRAAAPQGVTAAIDTVGTDEAVDVSLELVAQRRRIATIAAFGRAPGLGIQLLGGGPDADPGDELRAAARRPLADMAAEGRLRVVVAQTYPLAQAVDAHREIMLGHTTGKLVLLP